MRLSLVVPSWNRPCGVGEYSKALVAALAELGQPVEVMAVAPADVVPLARAKGLDLVHFQYEYSLCDARELARAAEELERAGIRSVVTVHSFDPGADYANRVIRILPRMIVTSPAIRLVMARAGVDLTRLVVIPIGIPLHQLPDHHTCRATVGLSGDPAIGYFGFVHRHKGLENLGLAVRDLRQAYPGLRAFLFTCVAPNEGSRQAYEALRSFYDAHGLWDCIDLRLGYPPEEEVVRHLHAMDVNVLPYAELSGVQSSAAVRTVLAACRPTIVTDTAHFSDLGDGVMRISDAHPSRIAAAVRAVLENPALRRDLAGRAAACARRFAWANVGQAHLRYYATFAGDGAWRTAIRSGVGR